MKRRKERTTDGRNVWRAVLAIASLSVVPSFRLSAQQPDTTHPAPIITTGATVVPTDTTHRVRPMGAFLRSFVLPGWGQAATGRRVTGALFVAWEGLAAMMTLKAQSEYHYIKESGASDLEGAKRQQVQDWLVLWVFNHLFSGAEAFVSAHLQDFPKDLKIRAFPDGPGGRGMGIGVSLPLQR